MDFDSGSLADAKLELVCVNHASVVLPAVQGIIGLLSSFTPRAGLSWIELALQEAVRNAYEHGNLGFTSKEKTDLCEADRFDDAVKEREAKLLPEGKQIRIQVRISTEEFSCTIEDDGKGFNWQEAMSACIREDLPLEELRGRGLLLIAKVFDTVAFNEKGNKVTLKKRLPLS